jgi:hypothetical protein
VLQYYKPKEILQTSIPNVATAKLPQNYDLCR